jgi:hypothetical protein
MPVGRRGAAIWRVVWREGRQLYAQHMQADSAGEIRHLFNVSAGRMGGRIVSVERTPLIEIVGDIGVPIERAVRVGADNGNAA